MDKPMKTLKINGVVYEIIDDFARGEINTLQLDVKTLQEAAENAMADINEIKDTAITLDTSLSISGSAADAKETGDAISDLSTSVNNKINDLSANVNNKAESKHEHSTSDITSGYLPIERGGTGATDQATALINLGAAAIEHTHSFDDITTTILPLSRGGTGSSNTLNEAPNNAIIYKQNDDTYNQLSYKAVSTGALYATEENGSLKFGALPVAQGGTGATTSDAARANIGAASKESYTATLSDSGWSSDAPYTQTVTVSGILSTDNPLVDIDLSSATLDTIGDLKDSWSYIDRIVTADNKITAYCYEEKPDKALKIKLMVVR